MIEPKQLSRRHDGPQKATVELKIPHALNCNACRRVTYDIDACPVREGEMGLSRIPGTREVIEDVCKFNHSKISAKILHWVTWHGK
jgi:hypothetical protein